jgi:hypothetical protein
MVGNSYLGVTSGLSVITASYPASTAGLVKFGFSPAIDRSLLARLSVLTRQATSGLPVIHQIGSGPAFIELSSL